MTIDETILGDGPRNCTISTVVLSDIVSQLIYHGGPVISNPTLVPLFYGTEWTATDAPKAVQDFPLQIQDAMESMVNGPYTDFLSQYGTLTQDINRGQVLAGEYSNDNKAGALLTDNGPDYHTSGLKSVIWNHLKDTGDLPDPNKIYVVFTPPGTVIQSTRPAGDSKNNYYAYHSNFSFVSDLNGLNYRIWYIIMPWEASPNATFGNLSTDVFKEMSRTFSHEYAETVTDPDGSGGWFDSNGQEIGDLDNSVNLGLEPEGGNSSYGTVDGTLVQYEWANKYTFPGTGLEVRNQPVLPVGPDSTILTVNKIVVPFKKFAGAASVTDAGFSFSGLIATFDDTSNATNDPTIYTATIDWGDDTTSTGTVAYDANLKQYLISGSHNFTTAAGSTATIGVSLVNNQTGGIASFTADVKLQQATTQAANVQFDKSTFDAYRNGSDAAITVDRVGDTTLSSTVDYHVSGGTAVDGTDFQAEAGTLTFPPGATTATILLPIYSNPAATGNVTVNLMLSTPTGNTVLGTQATTTVTIHPSDQVFAPPAPVLDNDTGQFVNDGITAGNGSAAAPLTFKVTGASVRNGYVQLVDVTDPDNPVLLGDAVQATNGAATITLNNGALTDGTHDIAVINSVGLTAGARRASQATEITIDSVSPTSKLTGVPAFTKLTSLPVNWSGNDNAAGSGLQGFNISVSVDGAAATPWLTNTTDTSATFSATLGHSYAFFSSAIDVAGNSEPTHAIADASVVVTDHPWHNSHVGRDRDVTDDGHVVADDVVNIINYINAKGSGPLPASNPNGSSPRFIDTDGDNQVTATDVVFVINFINAHPGLGEAEAESADPAAILVSQASSEDSALTISDSLLLLIATDLADQSSGRRTGRG